MINLRHGSKNGIKKDVSFQIDVCNMEEASWMKNEIEIIGNEFIFTFRRSTIYECATISFRDISILQNQLFITGVSP